MRNLTARRPVGSSEAATAWVHWIDGVQVCHPENPPYSTTVDGLARNAIEGRIREGLDEERIRLDVMPRHVARTPGPMIYVGGVGR